MSRTSRPTVRRALRGAVIVTTGLAVAAVPLGAVAGSANATTATAAKGCATGTLPASVQGKPAGFKAGLPAGAWVWHDKNGFHLRVTHDSKSKETFYGTITSSRHIAAHRVLAERNDVLWKNNRHTAVRFTFRNYGGVDGIDFTVGCAKTVKITLSTKTGSTAAVKLATTQIHIGKANTNPTTNGFAITRTKS